VPKRAAIPLRLSVSQPFTQQIGSYLIIGERTNITGSPRFAKALKAGAEKDTWRVSYSAAFQTAKR